MRSDCPSDQVLLAFHLGMLAASEVDQVADHLEGCTRCTGTLVRLEDAADPVLSALRKAHAQPPSRFTG